MQSNITSENNFSHFNIVDSSSFFSTYPTFGMRKSVHEHENILVWALLDNEEIFKVTCESI